jgi:uncharacterized membrane protein HdeD (DUF308 family)
MSRSTLEPDDDPRLFWWVYAIRGGFSLLFAVLLFMIARLFGSFFLDPIVLVYLSLLLGFYVLGSGILLGVASGFAAEHHLGLWKVLLADCIFAVIFGCYIGLSLSMTPHTLGLLAGIHALGIGVFEIVLAVRMRRDRACLGLLGTAALLCILAGCLFFSQMQQPIEITTRWLSYFEVFCALVTLAFVWRLRGRNLPQISQTHSYPGVSVSL